MEIKNRTNGVTLIVLTITIVILLILTGIVLYYGKDTIKMAIVVISTLPVICAYPFFQKYFVSGLTVGAVKE